MKLFFLFVKPSGLKSGQSSSRAVSSYKVIAVED